MERTMCLASRLDGGGALNRQVKGKHAGSFGVFLLFPPLPKYAHRTYVHTHLLVLLQSKAQPPWAPRSALGPCLSSPPPPRRSPMLKATLTPTIEAAARNLARRRCSRSARSSSWAFWREEEEGGGIVSMAAVCVNSVSKAGWRIRTRRPTD